MLKAIPPFKSPTFTKIRELTVSRAQARRSAGSRLFFATGAAHSMITGCSGPCLAGALSGRYARTAKPSIRESPTGDADSQILCLLIGTQADAVDPHTSGDLAVDLQAHGPSHFYEQQIGISAGREFSVLLRPAAGTNKILGGCEEITRMVRIADLKFWPATRTDALGAHVAGKLVLRIRSHEYVLEHMTVVEIA